MIAPKSISYDLNVASDFGSHCLAFHPPRRGLWLKIMELASIKFVSFCQYLFREVTNAPVLRATQEQTTSAAVTLMNVKLEISNAHLEQIASILW